MLSRICFLSTYRSQNYSAATRVRKLIDYSQKMTMAAMQIADMNV